MADDARTALFDGIERDLAGVETALARLDAGTYFTCTSCGDDLGTAVTADPTATVCPTCLGTGTGTGEPIAPVEPTADNPLSSGEH